MKYRLPMLLDGASQNEQSEAAEPPSRSLASLFRQDIRSGARVLFLRIPTEYYPLDEDSEERFRKIAAEYAEAARKAIAEENAECPIAGVIAPVTADDEDELSFMKLVDIYTDAAAAYAEAGCDIISAEEMGYMEECRAAVIGGRKTALPVWVTVTSDSEGMTLPDCADTSVFACLLVAQELGAEAFGIQDVPCCADAAEVLGELKEFAKIPLIARPNAFADFESERVLSPDEFAENLRLFTDSGAELLGGHNLSREYIERSGKIAEEKGIIRFGRERVDGDELLLANRRQVFFLSPDSIESSPYLECSLDMSDELLELEDTNFDVIAVELYSSDDAYHFARNASMANLPVMFRSDDEMALKAALLCYQGRAMIDRSCSIDEDRLHRIAGKYGAVVY